jgi:hypothetical protein
LRDLSVEKVHEGYGIEGNEIREVGIGSAIPSSSVNTYAK